MLELCIPYVLLSFLSSDSESEAIQGEILEEANRGSRRVDRPNRQQDLQQIEKSESACQISCDQKEVHDNRPAQLSDHLEAYQRSNPSKTLDPKLYPSIKQPVESSAALSLESASSESSSAASESSAAESVKSIDAFRFLVAADETSSTDDEEEKEAVNKLKTRASRRAQRASSYLRETLTAAAKRDRTMPLDHMSSEVTDPGLHDAMAVLTPVPPQALADVGCAMDDADTIKHDPTPSWIKGGEGMTRRPKTPAQGSAIKVCLRKKSHSCAQARFSGIQYAIEPHSRQYT